MKIYDFFGHGARIGESRKFDLFVVIIFASFSAALGLLLLLTPLPRIVPSSDIGALFTKVVAESEPQRFAEDYVYSDHNIAKIYVSLAVPLVQYLSKLAPDIGTAWLWLQGPIVFLMLFGFYLLARQLRLPPYLAFVGGFACSMPIVTLEGDFWGFYQVPYPRVMFGALVPWLLLLFFRAPINRLKPFLLMAVMGVASYVHLPSGPTLAFGILLACFSCRPDSVNRNQWFIVLFFAGLLYLLFMSPFALLYMSTYPGGEKLSSQNVYVADFPESYHNALLAFRSFLFPLGVGYELLFHSLLISLAYIGGVGCLLGFAFRGAGDDGENLRRKDAQSLLLALLGIFIASVLICLIDQTLATILNRSPLQLELIRGQRLMAPLLILGLFAGLAYVAGSSRLRYSLCSALAGLAVVAHLVSPLGSVSLPLRRLLLTGSAVSAEEREAGEVVRVLAAEPPGTQILPLNVRDDVETAIRYYARQPLVYMHKDGNFLGYSNSKVFFDWQRRRAAIEAFLSSGQDDTSLRSLFEVVSVITRPRVVVVERCPPHAAFCRDITKQDLVIAESARLIFDGKTYKVYQLGAVTVLQ